MSLSNGVLNLTNWVGNVILPTLAGLFAAAAIYHFSKGRHYQNFAYAAMASLMCSGLMRVLESFSNQSAWNNPDRFWIALLTLVNWVGNVIAPVGAALAVVMAVVAYSQGRGAMRWAVTAGGLLVVSGLTRLIEFWIQNGTAGVQ